MEPSQELLAQLRRHEGFEGKPYKDTVGKLTIGYGRNLDDVGINRVEGELLLANDVAKVLAQAERTFPWFKNVSPARQNVILNMIFNLGLEKFKLFRQTLAAMESGNADLAAERMLNSLWATQVKGRATELAEQYRTG